MALRGSTWSPSSHAHEFAARLAPAPWTPPRDSQNSPNELGALIGFAARAHSAPRPIGPALPKRALASNSPARQLGAAVYQLAAPLYQPESRPGPSEPRASIKMFAPAARFACSAKRRLAAWASKQLLNIRRPSCAPITWGVRVRELCAPDARPFPLHPKQSADT